jgi:hypothetical protein
MPRYPCWAASSGGERPTTSAPFGEIQRSTHCAAAGHGRRCESSEETQVNPSVETISREPPRAGIPCGCVALPRRSTATNERLVTALRKRGVHAQLVDPARLWGTARRGHAVVGRLDVRPTLDGVEDGIWELRRVEGRGTRVLNPASSLFACHDRLQTALRLAAASVPPPTTGHIDETGPRAALELPADAVAGDLVGVDLLPCADGGCVVLEVNGAVEFTAEYSLCGRDVFHAVAAEICAEDPPVEIAVATPS